ncbi:Sodium/potassium/calcium exchanger 5 like protein [Argiope bruennichi]|uniref:Sodium/potassium/calcium exchanger 5 like protein n=1 Tax=Argiope bruennichi TaxID=94029 RepID=A0A8T0FCA4_ARGBR|nr:Sodium/potassium/calcium exchanger 5 like protein [Argiope bruennichi]
MWKLYQRRHLWLLIVYRFFSKFYGSFRGEGSDTLQQISPHGRKILSIDNSTSSPDDVGVVPSCIPPSLDEFPDDFFTQEQRVRGGLIVHALIIAYICLMLAIVCDKYFVPCLKVMSSYFKVPTDIAGATFMAVGASSPELFSSVIGAFVTEGDIGVGTVVGSAVFNILAVTGAAGFAVGSAAVQLDWYPITRDCVMYIITISTLVVIIHDNIVTWIESIVLILMFVGYLVVLYFNCHVQEVTTRTARHFTIWWQNKKGESMDLLPRTYVDESSALLVANRLANRYHSNEDSACPSMTSSLMASDEMTTSGESDTLAKESGHYKVPILVPELITQKYILVKDLDDDTDTLQKGFHSLFSPFGPWLGAFPTLFLDAAVIGYTLGIPDTVSGLTILAAGTSIPELVSSVIFVKKGDWATWPCAICWEVTSSIFYSAWVSRGWQRPS